MLSYVKALQEAWNDATWEISSNVRARSLGAAYLETCAKALMRAAAALSNNQKNGSHRQAEKLPIERKPETQQRHGEQEDEKPPGFHAERPPGFHAVSKDSAIQREEERSCR